jgi:hypothetical protein
MAKQKKHVAARVEPEFVSAVEAEIMTGRSKWTWRKDANRGRIASVKLGRRLLIPISEIRRLLAEGVRPRVEQIS